MSKSENIIQQRFDYGLIGLLPFSWRKHTHIEVKPEMKIDDLMEIYARPDTEGLSGATLQEGKSWEK